jgi:hypothetical protein
MDMRDLINFCKLYDKQKSIALAILCGAFTIKYVTNLLSM